MRIGTFQMRQLSPESIIFLLFSILFYFLLFMCLVLGFESKHQNVTFCGNILKRVKIAFGGLDPWNWLVEWYWHEIALLCILTTLFPFFFLSSSLLWLQQNNVNKPDYWRRIKGMREKNREREREREIENERGREREKWRRRNTEQ